MFMDVKDIAEEHEEKEREIKREYKKRKELSGM